MDFISQLLASPYAVATLSFLAGIAGTVIATQVMGRRSVFTYFVNHSQVGLSVDDAIFGRVRVTWNQTDVARLYHSTVELTNSSFTDFQEVKVTVFTANTRLLSQRTALVDTPDMVPFTDEYAATVRVEQGQAPTEQQLETWNRRREYFLPTFNRGQKAQFSFLSVPDKDERPSLWLNVNHPGVRVRFHTPMDTFWGTPRPHAAFIGLLVGCAVVTIMLTLVERPWIVAVTAFVIGSIAQVPGAAVIRTWRWLKDWYGG